jgi:hypothetical protein
MVHQFSQKTTSHSIGIHKFHLPSQITVYPKEFDEGETSGFHLSQGWGDLKIRQPEQTWVQQASDDPYSTTTHELGHELWEQLTPEERDEYISSLEGWWKREFTQRAGKLQKAYVEKDKMSPEQASESVKEQFNYYAEPTEAFARMTKYVAQGRREPPKWESEEAWNKFRSIFKKRGGNKLFERIVKAGVRVERATKPYEWRKTKKNGNEKLRWASTKMFPEWQKRKKFPEEGYRTMEVSLRGI